MASSISRTVHVDLEYAIYLLALVTGRSSETIEAITSVQGAGVHLRASGDAPIGEATDDGGQDEARHDADGVEAENSQVFDVVMEAQHHLSQLRNKFLRLAETLARFEPDPKSRKSLDAKHVASTMIMVNKEAEAMRIVCAENEGPDRTDSGFLSAWSCCMEAKG